MTERYLTSEVARMLNCSTEALRYYNNVGILSPTRGDNKYRYFELPEISDTFSVLNLRDAGVPIAQIKQISGAQDYDAILNGLQEADKILREKQTQLDFERENLTELAKRVEQFRFRQKEVTLRYAPAWDFYEIPKDMGMEDFLNVYQHLSESGKNGIHILYSVKADDLLEGVLTYTKRSFAIEPPRSANGWGKSNETSLYANLQFIGHRDERAQAYQKLLFWLDSHQYHPHGELLEEYVLSNSNLYLSILWLRVSPR